MLSSGTFSWQAVPMPGVASLQGYCLVIQMGTFETQVLSFWAWMLHRRKWQTKTFGNLILIYCTTKLL